MTIRSSVVNLLALGALLAFRAQALSAQTQVISLGALVSSTLTVLVQSGAAQNITAVLDNAVNDFPAPVVIQTGWIVSAGQTNTVSLVAYFSLPALALIDGATAIPSSRVLGRMTTGLATTFTAITQNGIGGVGSAGGSLELFSVNVTGSNTRTDNLDLQLDLVGLSTLPAGTYAGVLNIQAVTQ